MRQLYLYPDNGGPVIIRLTCSSLIPGIAFLNLGRERQQLIKCLVMGQMHRVGLEPMIH